MLRLSLLLLSTVILGKASPLSNFDHLETLYRIESHNANPVRTYNMSFNKITALSSEEFKLRLGLRVPDILPTPTEFPVAKGDKVPESIDWREYGIVSPVKNQGACCSSWAFAAVAAMEGQYAMKKGEVVSLSEQNLIDCSTTYGNFGCNGGTPDNAYEYAKRNGGIDTEESYPYHAQDETCHFDEKDVGGTDEGYVDLPRGDEEELKNAVATIGPISVGIQVIPQTFSHYSEGVYYDENCSTDPHALNHAVLIVGYGTDSEHGDYWIVKNSWGRSFGEKGYIRMARNRGNNCGIATLASYPIVE